MSYTVGCDDCTATASSELLSREDAEDALLAAGWWSPDTFWPRTYCPNCAGPYKEFYGVDTDDTES